MKKIIATIFMFHCLTVSFGQSSVIKSMVDSLQYLKVDTLDCNASLYWRIVAKGDKAIPFLIDKLNDTTPTKISNSCKATKLNVGEVSYFALQQIAFFPALLHIFSLTLFIATVVGASLTIFLIMVTKGNIKT
jgi:hypothetical protein